MAAAVVAVSGVLSFGVTVPMQQLLIALAPGAGPVLTSLYQSAAHLAVSAAAVDGWGGSAVGPLGAGFVLAAAVLTATGGRRRLDP
ncbi:hypothetical protein [Pseudonocardia adelaidensis]|uniref:MFS transporter n=1 Tax=Pseudonocardia adelaidensis TaxID=648754 RepID=A0ABP9NJU2_9PSEU